VSPGSPPGPSWSGASDVPERTGDERWARALARVARGRPRTAEATRRGPRQLAWLLAVVGTLTALGLVLIALHLAGGGPAWRQPVAWTLTGVQTALCLGGAVVAWGSGTLRNSWPDVQPELTRDQRREVAAQLRGTVPVDPAHVPLVREWALCRVAQVPLLLLVVGFQQLRLGDLGDEGALDWFALSLVVLWLGVLGSFFVQLRRARRFLLAHPEPAAG